MSFASPIAWPEDAEKHLLSIIKTGLEPLCLQIDKNFIVQNYWGNPGVFKLNNLAVGKSANQLAFVVGFEDIDEPVTLKFVQISPQCVAHIHLYRSANHLYVTLFDVTDEHDYIQPIQQGANEAQLKNFYDQQLIAKLERTQDELNRKKAEIEAVSQLKSGFIASMSHEFRTPITSIIGYADILQQALSENNSSTNAIDVIRRNAYFLLNMVNNILDEARLESGDLDTSVSEIDIRDTLDFIKHMFTGLAEKKGLAFKLSIDDNVPEYLIVDEMRLQQMLINIIGNAVKFTMQGEVGLQVAYIDDFVIFDISDTGAGISALDQQKIFQPFQRLASQQQGAGLGLSITQRLLEIMGGSLQLRSQLNVGSTFTLSLPVKTVDSVNQNSVDFQKKTIFVIEDNQDISDLLTIFLNEMGIKATVIADGMDAEASILEYMPDLVIMDMNLPNRSGVDITQALRLNGYSRPVIAFSAAGLLASKEQALAAGCDDYIDKTDINSRRLRKVLMRYLAYVPTAKPEFSSKLDALKQKYQKSLPQKMMVIQSTWRNCQSNNYDVVACKMLYTLTHNLAGSAGSYEFNELSQAAKQVNTCIDSQYKVKDESLLQANMHSLLKALKKYE